MTKLCFFTSSMMTSIENETGKFAVRIENTNHFLDKLQANWPDHARVLMISSSPTAHSINEFYRDIYIESFRLSDLPYVCIDILDDRYQVDIHSYDVLILAGGHTPTQNKYFAEINLKESLANYNGVIVGISAGSMNAADVVYAHPELEGEAVDPNYQRLLSGLALFNKRILPHFQDSKDMMLDGYRLEDIAMQDSHLIDFYAMNDGVYFYQNGKELYLCGEALYFNKGIVTVVGKPNVDTKIAD